jgi:hypothetical protein
MVLVDAAMDEMGMPSYQCVTVSAVEVYPGPVYYWACNSLRYFLAFFFFSLVFSWNTVFIPVGFTFVVI